jgi:hypothetical protein
MDLIVCYMTSQVIKLVRNRGLSDSSQKSKRYGVAV